MLVWSRVGTEAVPASVKVSAKFVKNSDFAEHLDAVARDVQEAERYTLSKFQTPTTLGDPQGVEI